ncbi:uncharacterized protein M8220_003610 isoform 2-T2 [Acridotheres tristis]
MHIHAPGTPAVLLRGWLSFSLASQTQLGWQNDVITATASNPNSSYCLCKLRVRSHLSREIAGTSAQSSRIYRQLSPECPLGIWKRAFGSHMEEHKRQWQTRNENPAAKGN